MKGQQHAVHYLISDRRKGYHKFALFCHSCICEISNWKREPFWLKPRIGCMCNSLKPENTNISDNNLHDWACNTVHKIGMKSFHTSGNWFYNLKKSCHTGCKKITEFQDIMSYKATINISTACNADKSGFKWEMCLVIYGINTKKQKNNLLAF